MGSLGGTLKQSFQVAAIAAALAALAMAVLFTVNAVVFSQGPSAVRATLQRSIAEGSINTTRHLGPLPFVPLRLTTNPGGPLFGFDCQIWQTLIVPGLDATLLSLRTIRVAAAKLDIDPRAPGNADCQAILQLVQPEIAARAQPTNVAYDRYIMGQRALAQLLLSNLSLTATTIVLHVAVYAAFLFALGVAWRRHATSVVVICAVFLLFYGLSHFGGTIFFAPSDMTHAAFIAIALLLRLGAAPLRTCAVVGALYGALIAQFDILTGGVPVGLAVIALLVGHGAPDLRTFMRSVSIVVAAFCIAFVGCVVIRLLVVSLIEGSNQFAVHFPGLLHRLRGDVTLESPPNLVKQYISYLDRPFGQVVYLIRIYYPWSRLVGWGSPVFGSILVVGGLLALAATTLRVVLLRRTSNRPFPPQLMGCLLGLGFLIAWIALFWNHTLVHPFFMARILVIPIMCGAVAVVVMRAELRQRAQLAPGS